MFYSLCYPTLSNEDNNVITSYRKTHDLPFRDVVAHHFTIAFGVSDLGREEYFNHVRMLARQTRKINFTCRYAMLGNDDSNDNFYVFLVPDEGFSEISLLHDQIYRGPLAPYHKLEIPYIPHIGIATIPDSWKVKALCEELNESGLNITGSLDGITICEYTGSVINDLEYVQFAR